MQKKTKALVFLVLSLLLILLSWNYIPNKYTEFKGLENDVEFQIVLREGIVGGFVGPTIKQVIDIKRNPSGAIVTHTNLKPKTKTEYDIKVGDVSLDDLSKLFNILKQELQRLPIEDPIGSEDIYGQDISISFFSNDFQWFNGGPDGCSQGESSIKVTEDQKETFKSLIDIIKNLGQKYAIYNQ